MTRNERIRLGINIDHVATVRNARGGDHPEPLRAALLVRQAGADSITVHLREDRRHIRDADVADLSAQADLPLNLEIAPTAEMQAIALRHRPRACCLVPEKRQELTTEGGLDIVRLRNRLPQFCAPLRDAGIRVSLFVEPERHQIETAKAVGAAAVELHTGAYCNAVAAGDAARAGTLLAQLREAARIGQGLGLEIHAGHGLTYDCVAPVAAIPEIVELNIGHFLVGEALFVGLERSVRGMRDRMDQARATILSPGEIA